TSETEAELILSANKDISFLTLSDLPISFFSPQCVVYKDEILICANDCYSYHTIKQEYKLICSYPDNINLGEHNVMKIVNNNNPNDITLLSFGRESKMSKILASYGYAQRYAHTLIMKYVSVWEEKDFKKDSYRNQWIQFTDNTKPLLTLEYKEDGVRALIGGSNNHLLFITYLCNIDVFDLNTCKYINHSNLLINGNDCFVLRTENRLSNKIHEMVLFCEKMGLSIKYDEDKNELAFKNLTVCNDIAPFNTYTYVYVNDCILFFGEFGNVFIKTVYKYSIKEKKWMKFEHTLPIRTRGSVAILSGNNKWIHIIGGYDDKNNIVLPIHRKTKVEDWMNKEEKERNEKEEIKIKKGEVEEERKNEDERAVKKLITKEEKKKWMTWWKERNEKEKQEIMDQFKTLDRSDFEKWLLKNNQWKNYLKKENLFVICDVIDSYITYHTYEK
ncbi:hypothetical protein RFI_12918, partial [Reticulomyxa filosa]